jgi:PilZ domain-containing protein
VRVKIHEDWSGPDPVTAHCKDQETASQMASLERRVFTRAACGLQAILECGGDHFASEILDVSLSGTLVNTGASPRKGSPVSVTFTIPGSEPLLEVHCLGHVVRSDQRGVGIEFSEMSAGSFRRLQQVVAAQGDDELDDLEDLAL